MRNTTLAMPLKSSGSTLSSIDTFNSTRPVMHKPAPAAAALVISTRARLRENH
ncbi:MAG TPA: hypothetical protein VJ656_00500 [Pyrinomonadaceae bacterium]|nr:hypothetical protein [Pyrinomonadaceae bacterium]